MLSLALILLSDLFLFSFNYFQLLNVKFLNIIYSIKSLGEEVNSIKTNKNDNDYNLFSRDRNLIGFLLSLLADESHHLLNLL